MSGINNLIMLLEEKFGLDTYWKEGLPQPISDEISEKICKGIDISEVFGQLWFLNLEKRDVWELVNEEGDMLSGLDRFSKKGKPHSSIAGLYFLTILYDRILKDSTENDERMNKRDELKSAHCLGGIVVCMSGSAHSKKVNKFLDKTAEDYSLEAFNRYKFGLESIDENSEEIEIRKNGIYRIRMPLSSVMKKLFKSGEIEEDDFCLALMIWSNIALEKDDLKEYCIWQKWLASFEFRRECSEEGFSALCKIEDKILEKIASEKSAKKREELWKYVDDCLDRIHRLIISGTKCGSLEIGSTNNFRNTCKKCMETAVQKRDLEQLCNLVKAWEKFEFEVGNKDNATRVPQKGISMILSIVSEEDSKKGREKLWKYVWRLFEDMKDLLNKISEGKFSRERAGRYDYTGVQCLKVALEKKDFGEYCKFQKEIILFEFERGRSENGMDRLAITSRSLLEKIKNEDSEENREELWDCAREFLLEIHNRLLEKYKIRKLDMKRANDLSRLFSQYIGIANDVEDYGKVREFVELGGHFNFEINNLEEGMEIFNYGGKVLKKKLLLESGRNKEMLWRYLWEIMLERIRIMLEQGKNRMDWDCFDESVYVCYKTLKDYETLERKCLALSKKEIESFQEALEFILKRSKENEELACNGGEKDVKRFCFAADLFLLYSQGMFQIGKTLKDAKMIRQGMYCAYRAALCSLRFKWRIPTIQKVYCDGPTDNHLFAAICLDYSQEMSEHLPAMSIVQKYPSFGDDVENYDIEKYPAYIMNYLLTLARERNLCAIGDIYAENNLERLSKEIKKKDRIGEAIKDLSDEVIIEGLENFLEDKFPNGNV